MQQKASSTRMMGGRKRLYRRYHIRKIDQWTRTLDGEVDVVYRIPFWNSLSGSHHRTCVRFSQVVRRFHRYLVNTKTSSQNQLEVVGSHCLKLGYYHIDTFSRMRGGYVQCRNKTKIPQDCVHILNSSSIFLKCTSCDCAHNQSFKFILENYATSEMAPSSWILMRLFNSRFPVSMVYALCLTYLMYEGGR